MAGRNVALQSLPKYSPRERFHLEVWCPPEMYGTPEDWGRQFRKTIAGEAIDTLGPYPSMGEYEHLWECSDVDGGYLHPTVNLVFRAIRQHKRAAEMDRAKRRQDRDDFEAQKEKAETTARRDATRQLAKEFVEKALPGRTVQELKSELTAPKERKRWRSR